MQISIGEVEKVLKGSGLPGASGRKQVSTPEQLAESYGVNPREVEQQVRRMLLSLIPVGCHS